MKSVGLVVNQKRDCALSVTQKTVEILTESGFRVLSFEPLLPNVEVLERDDFFAQAQMIVTLGGDGTILHIAQQAAHSKTPILGVNLGHLGYLTRLSKEEIQLLPKILSDVPQTEERMMLSVHLNYKNGKAGDHIVLNDAVICRKNPGGLLRLHLYANDTFVYTYHGDGLIFSTPTGSTAYSLSAGGPIVDTGLQNVTVVNPICEHSLFSKTMLFSAGEVLKCDCDESSASAVLILDGHSETDMADIADITVTKSGDPFLLVCPSGNRFYEILNKKFSGGEQGRQQ